MKKINTTSSASAALVILSSIFEGPYYIKYSLWICTLISVIIRIVRYERERRMKLVEHGKDICS
ncbi:hypothetical protein CLV32_0225 [Pedobacter duraquae]|uniref:Uncharacterized protein n=1 Tax=Pedobacter duraquae TaxID=425511 RepID=A0A4R6INU6_9SPHI|nr:hypothetical protein CLV32_0225 [Pedobacter duraquae]